MTDRSWGPTDGTAYRYLQHESNQSSPSAELIETGVAKHTAGKSENLIGGVYKFWVDHDEDSTTDERRDRQGHPDHLFTASAHGSLTCWIGRKDLDTAISSANSS